MDSKTDSSPSRSPARLRRPLISGAWAEHPHMEDYRHEWFGSLLVERATWKADAPVLHLAGTQVSGPGYVWFRFWLAEGGHVVEKYFDPEGKALGMFVPVGPPVRLRGEQYRTEQLLLGLWLQPDGRVHVLGEEAFDQAVDQDLLPEAEVAQAERRIRQLTLEIGRGRFPPPLVRNFEIRADPGAPETPEATESPERP